MNWGRFGRHAWRSARGRSAAQRLRPRRGATVDPFPGVATPHGVLPGAARRRHRLPSAEGPAHPHSAVGLQSRAHCRLAPGEPM